MGQEPTPSSLAGSTKSVFLTTRMYNYCTQQSASGAVFQVVNGCAAHYLHAIWSQTAMKHPFLHGAHNAGSFQDQSVVDRYHLRPAYPPETFTKPC